MLDNIQEKDSAFLTKYLQIKRQISDMYTHKKKFLVFLVAIAICFSVWYRFYRGASLEPITLLVSISVVTILMLLGVNYKKRYENTCLMAFSAIYSFFISLTRYLRIKEDSIIILFLRIAVPYIIILLAVFVMLRGLLLIFDTINFTTNGK